jgi:hypothetical protein
VKAAGKRATAFDRDPGRIPAARQVVAGRHIRFGWWALFVFAVLGVVLESLHGFKVRWYLDVSNETRRLMWTLAHAHGIGLAIVNVLFGLYLAAAPGVTARGNRFASPALIGATLLLPGGFLAGGIVFYSGDPGIGIVLLPIGAALLLLGLYWIAAGSADGISSPRNASANPQPVGGGHSKGGNPGTEV